MQEAPRKGNKVITKHTKDSVSGLKKKTNKLKKKNRLDKTK